MIKNHKKPTFKDSLEDIKKKSSAHLSKNRLFNVSFRYIDESQEFGASIDEWQEMGILAKAIIKLKGYCNAPLISQFDGKTFTNYKNFPAKTKFIHPEHVPPDANWCRIHVDGKQVIAGHFVENTFYIVFLDTYHMFWISTLKHT